MAGRTDIEISNARLNRLAPVTKRIRDEADSRRYQNDPTWPARALMSLAAEDQELCSQEADRLKSIHDEGKDPDRDEQALAFLKARQRLRETIAEVSGIALEVCPASPQDRSAAHSLFQLQRAEFWSLRTGFGAYRDTLRRPPKPRGRKIDRDTLEKEADVLAAMALAETEEALTACLQQATEAGLNASELKAKHEGLAVVEEALQEEVERRTLRLRKAVQDRVEALQAEKARDPTFFLFLLNEGWIRPTRFWAAEIT